MKKPNRRASRVARTKRTKAKRRAGIAIVRRKGTETRIAKRIKNAEVRKRGNGTVKRTKSEAIGIEIESARRIEIVKRTETGAKDTATGTKIASTADGKRMSPRVIVIKKRTTIAKRRKIPRTGIVTRTENGRKTANQVATRQATVKTGTENATVTVIVIVRRIGTRIVRTATETGIGIMTEIDLKKVDTAKRIEKEGKKANGLKRPNLRGRTMTTMTTFTATKSQVPVNRDRAAQANQIMKMMK